MSEEKSNDPNITNDDLDVLRVLLHNIKGISAVSTTNDYTQASSTSDE